MVQAHPFRRRLGRYVESRVAGEAVRAYVPAPLPPDPPIDVLPLLDRLGRAERAIGRLDGLTLILPRPDVFLHLYVRKEAVLSSQIEGTQSTLSDLFRFESEAASGRPVDDLREVSNYVDAMMHGLERLPTFPLSLRLIREMHARLLRSGRGRDMDPGEFRRTQNWIGGTRPGNALFVPPPVLELGRCLGELEAFMHEDGSGLPVLIKAGLLHVQFETIHPFLDGNGRIGRLLVTLFLCMNGVLSQPLLYLSLYLKTHRDEYYRLLQEVRTEGAWEAWLGFFLDGVAETATQASDAAGRIVQLFREDRALINDSESAGSVLRVHDDLQQNPYVTAAALAARTRLTAPTVNAALGSLAGLGIVEEVTGRQRGRVYGYKRYLDILGEGTEPLPPG